MLLHNNSQEEEKIIYEPRILDIHRLGRKTGRGSGELSSIKMFKQSGNVADVRESEQK